LGVLVLCLSGCADDGENNSEITKSEVDETAVVTSTQEDDLTNEVASETDDAPEIANDAGFLNQDMVLGDVNAPVEIIEYASLTCNHCATFHNQILPQIKKEFVDSGKAKVVFRSFLLNGVDAKISQLTRCVPEKRYVPFMNVLFGRQDQWLNFEEQTRLVGLYGQEAANEKFFEYIVTEVEKIAAQVGLNKSKVDACYNNEEVGKYIFSVHQAGIQQYQINSTPTIIVNGKKVNGNSFDAVKEAVENALD
jgi:protein-disulfide isomerase